MKKSLATDQYEDLESFDKLIQIMKKDSVINAKIVTILKLESYERCNVINYWLEQLRRQNAPENLKHALTCLFDDKIAGKVLSLINNPEI